MATTPADSTTSEQPALPNFFVGADLSYVNEMEDCGANYGRAQDPFTTFAEQGANLVRARLWHNPDWTDYSTLADVEKTFRRAQAAGMSTILAIHYSDEWADPGQQRIPAAWQDIENTEQLAQAVYDYTRDVLLTLHESGTLPHFVQVGNETNGGILKEAVGMDWPRDAQLFNAGIRAVRDVSEEVGQDTQIVLHIAQPENTGWWFREAVASGITDFDVIGISYYPQWSRMSIAQLGGQISYLRQTFGKEVMVVETAYPWTLEAAPESADNILTQGLRQYGISPQGQRDFLVDLTQTIINNGGLGVIYWEPAWVSTDCTTRWGQGSHWENGAFFDFQNNNEMLPAFEFFNAPYTFPSRLLEGTIHESYGAALASDLGPAGDSLEQTSHLDLDALYVSDDADYFYFALAVNGDVSAEAWGSYLIYIDTSNDQNGADVDVRSRPITVTAEHRPEFRLDIALTEENETLSGDFVLNGWNGTEWENLPFTGGTAISSGSTSIIEWQLPKSALNDPAAIWLGVVSVGRGRNNTAADILGVEPSPLDWSEPVTLSTFVRYQTAAP
jgi:arabinogalactan endo-1,4-beta-galactosidase